MLIQMNVAPSGLPRWRNRWFGEFCEEEDWGVDEEEEECCIDVLRRKSCVMAMPMLAKEREVRSQARKVRSVVGVEVSSERVMGRWGGGRW
jgi:hypothetical protein